MARALWGLQVCYFLQSFVYTIGIIITRNYGSRKHAMCRTKKKKSSNLLKAATRLAKQDDDRPSRHPKARGINYLLVLHWSGFGECDEVLISGDEVEEAEVVWWAKCSSSVG